ncbi:MAG: S8/S53 family peptidase [Alphaproteobacteria bacterium]|nr:S8/S53 family peptidase [Alphaproteobacteria bacterium]
MDGDFWGKLTAPPVWEKNNDGEFQFNLSFCVVRNGGKKYDLNYDFSTLDLRYVDVSDIDLSQLPEEVCNLIDFNTTTICPPEDKMPPKEFFDQEAIMENGKNPGLGVRGLHEKGITGKGIGVAIIDQTLLPNDPEIKDAIISYEEIDIVEFFGGEMQAQMHGPAVASIAVGKTVGVAPDANLYYFATHLSQDLDTPELQYNHYTQAVSKVLEINETLPDEEKIRVISMSKGWSEEEEGAVSLTQACLRAKEEGILVVSSNLEEIHGVKFSGLNCSPMADKDDPNSYGPGEWEKQLFFGKYKEEGGERLMVPMDQRTTSCCTGEGHYAHFASGGWSWAIPYIAGTYALACQADKTITPDKFLEVAFNTGTSVTNIHNDQEIELPGRVINPPAIIETLQNEKQQRQVVNTEMSHVNSHGGR